MNLSLRDQRSPSPYSAGHHRCAAVENMEHYGEVLMQLDVATAAAKAEHGGMLRVLLQGLAGRAVSKRGKLTQVRCSLQQDYKWPTIHRLLPRACLLGASGVSSFCTILENRSIAPPVGP